MPVKLNYKTSSKSGSISTGSPYHLNFSPNLRKYNGRKSPTKVGFQMPKKNLSWTDEILYGKGGELSPSDKERLEAMDETGLNTVHKAVLAREFKTLRELIKKGINLDIKSRRTEMTALIYASRHGDRDSTLLLLTAGCDMNEQDKDGWTALHHCSINDHLTLAEILIYMGVDLFILGKDNKSAVDIASTPEMRKLIQIAQQNVGGDDDCDIEKYCFQVHKNGGFYSAPNFCFELDIPKYVLSQNICCIVKRKRASHSSLKLDHGLKLISDTYELWPFDLTFSENVTVAFPCAQHDDTEDVVVLSSGDNRKDSLIKEKPVRQAPKNGSLFETIRRFSLSASGSIFAVAKQRSASVRIPRSGATVSTPGAYSVNIKVPKLGLNSVSTLVIQTDPISPGLNGLLESNCEGLLGIGPLVQVKHSEGETRTRRMIAMGIPLPANHKAVKNGGYLVAVSGTESGGAATIKGVRASHHRAEFSTRDLSWKIAAVVKPDYVPSITKVCSMVEQWICLHKQVIQFSLFYDQQATIVIECSCEDKVSTVRSFWIKRGFKPLAFCISSPVLIADENEEFLFQAGNLKSTLEFHSRTRNYKQMTFKGPKSDMVTVCITRLSGENVTPIATAEVVLMDSDFLIEQLL